MRCMQPFCVKNRMGVQSQVPCGRCPGCRAMLQSQWSWRLMQQDKVAISSLFLTLTYDSHFVSVSKHGFMDLRKRDVQLFFKRLRIGLARRGYSFESTPVKYFAVGEYGGRFKRPHYHAIVFGVPPELFSCIGVNGAGYLQYECKLITEAWGAGYVDIGSVTGASVGYTLKYITKPMKFPLHERDDRSKPFRVMSQGLGACYVKPSSVAWHRADLMGRMYVNYEAGKKVSMPRYIKKLLYSDDERKAIGRVSRLHMIERDMNRFVAGHVTSVRDAHQSMLASFRKMNNELVVIDHF